MNNTIEKEVFTPEKPEPLIKDPIQEAERYPLQALGEFEEVVFAMHDITQAPIALAAQSFLAVASLCTQDIANVEMLEGCFKPLSLYLLSLGQSGERKSATDSLLMNYVDDLQQKLSQENANKLHQYHINHELWASKRKALLSKLTCKTVKNTDDIQADLLALGKEPQKPIETIITTSDATIEGIFDLLNEGRPSIALMTDEGGKILGGHGMNKDNRLKSISSFSSFWDGKPASQVRRTTKSKTLYDKRFCMHLLVQPEIANNLFLDKLSENQGFLPRMLVTYPTSTIGYRLFKEADPKSKEIINDIGQKITQHLGRLSHIETVEDNDLTFNKIYLSAEAKEVLQKFYNETEIAQREGGKYHPIKAYASKVCEQVCRIAGVLTLFSDYKKREISCLTIQNAIELMRYYLDEILRITNNMMVELEIIKAETLRKWLINEYENEFINLRTIVQYAKGNFKSTRDAKQAVNILVEHKWLIPWNEPQMIDGHKSKEALKINRGSND